GRSTRWKIPSALGPRSAGGARGGRKPRGARQVRMVPNEVIRSLFDMRRFIHPGLSVLVAVFALIRGAHGATELPPFHIAVFSQIVSTGFDLTPKPPGSKSDQLTYRPAQSNYAGINLGYRWLSGSISFAVPASGQIRDTEGVSAYRDYRLTYYS